MKRALKEIAAFLTFLSGIWFITVCMILGAWADLWLINVLNHHIR